MFSSFRVGLGAGGRGICDRVLFRVTKSRVKNLEIVLARRPRPLAPGVPDPHKMTKHGISPIRRLASSLKVEKVSKKHLTFAK